MERQRFLSGLGGALATASSLGHGLRPDGISQLIEGLFEAVASFGRSITLMLGFG